MFDDTRGYSESVEHMAPLATRDGLLVWLTKLYNVNPGCLVRRGDIHIMYIYITYIYIDVCSSIFHDIPFFPSNTKLLNQYSYPVNTLLISLNPNLVNTALIQD